VIENRRKSPRLTGSLRATWKRGKRLVEAEVLDFSAEGFYLGTNETIPTGQLMDITVHVGAATLSLLCVSRFVGTTRRGPGIGVSIHVMTPEDAAQWRAFYDDQLAKRKAALPPGVAELIDHKYK